MKTGKKILMKKMKRETKNGETEQYQDKICSKFF